MAEQETTQTDSPIKLVYNGYGYEWKGSNVPNHLKGLWLGPLEAKRAAQSYLEGYFKRKAKKDALVNFEQTELEKLDMLSKKAELLSFAEEREITIDPDLKMPAQIKKFIKEYLENVDG